MNHLSLRVHLRDMQPGEMTGSVGVTSIHAVGHNSSRGHETETKSFLYNAETNTVAIDGERTWRPVSPNFRKATEDRFSREFKDRIEMLKRTANWQGSPPPSPTGLDQNPQDIVGSAEKPEQVSKNEQTDAQNTKEEAFDWIDLHRQYAEFNGTSKNFSIHIGQDQNFWGRHLQNHLNMNTECNYNTDQTGPR